MFTYLGLIINWLKAKQTQPCPRVQTKQRRGQTHNQFQHQKSKVKILPQTHPHHFTVVFGVVFFSKACFPFTIFAILPLKKGSIPNFPNFLVIIPNSGGGCDAQFPNWWSTRLPDMAVMLFWSQNGSGSLIKIHTSFLIIQNFGENTILAAPPVLCE